MTEFEKRLWGDLDSATLSAYMTQQVEIGKLRDEVKMHHNHIEKERNS